MLESEGDGRGEADLGAGDRGSGREVGEVDIRRIGFEVFVKRHGRLHLRVTVGIFNLNLVGACGVKAGSSSSSSSSSSL